jgi:hypothetical protein
MQTIFLNKIKKANPPGNSPFQKFLAHDRFTDLLKESKIPNYHQLGGFDFMARFPDINPDVAKGLASAYQNIFQVGNALNTGYNQIKNPVLTDEDITLEPGKLPEPTVKI